MNEREIDEALDAQLARLPRDIAQRRDLWPAIATRLQSDDATAAPTAAPTAPRRTANGWRQLAAAVVLVAVSSLTTYRVTSERNPAPAQIAAAELVRQELGAAQFLPAGYVIARQELSVAFEDSLARLSPATRRVVETNLHDIERSLAEISDALARDPGNTTLQQLLLAASTQELQYLDEVRRLALNVPSTGA